ncbi:MAG: DNA recombination protein RmuC [Calditrichaeota bacterium]|nr:DNA recombination protein RmuC [Calditrichota bacterium]MCB9367750.1 DNA recombination protein RmuC [Calditrichota bacterium]
MTTPALFILVAVIVAAALLLAFQLARLSRSTEAERERSAALETRLNMLQELVDRARQESQKTVSDELRETRRDLSEEQKIARQEVKSSLETFRNSMETLRASLSDDQSKARTESRDTLVQSVKSLTEQFAKLQTSNEQKLAEIQKRVDEKLSETITRNDTLFKGVTDRLTELHATNEKIQQFSQELDELQNILKAPKLRGELGEIEMERMLRDCLHPEQFAVQHALPGGRVDAVIFNPQGKLPIDSKFPLEAYNRMKSAESEAEADSARKEFVRHVKKHVEDIATKYISPPETLLFAVMYVPAEGVYYELLTNPELMEYARRRGVFPTSPTSFWALLQVTLIGFKGMKISEDARRISGLLSALGDDLTKFRSSFEKAKNQVRLAGNNMDDAARELDKVERKVEGIQHENKADELSSGMAGELSSQTDGTLWEP